MRANSLVAASLFVLLAGAPALAQVKASTVPISRDLVKLQVTVNGHPATIGIQNGGLARVGLKGGPTLGLVPVIKSGAITVTVYDIVADATTGNEGLRVVTKVTATLGQVVRVDQVALPFDLQLMEIVPATGAPAVITQAGEMCCIVCGETVTCGCWVVAECGQCCRPESCSCPWSPTASGTCGSAERRCEPNG